jgi:hypothetical protein
MAAVARLAVGLLEATNSAAFRDAKDGDHAEWLDSNNWGWALWTQAATGPFSGIPLLRDISGEG